MALPAAFLSSFLDPRTIPNLIHNRNGNSPITLPAAAQGSPPANTVPNAADSVEISTQPASRSGGPLAMDGSGVYRLVHADSFNLSAQSISMRLGSGNAGDADRNALAVLNEAVEDSGLTGSGAMDRLHSSLEKLGLDDRNIRDLLLVAGLLEKLDPEAFRKFVDNIESFAESVSAGIEASSGTRAAAQAPAQASGGGFELHYVSINISMTEVTARSASAGEGGDGAGAEGTARSFELRFERLDISLRSQGARQLQEGDPVVLDLKGDGTDLRPTSDGVLFDLIGSGRPVRTAFVQGDDALLFYDANANGLLDDGRELVGNRTPGLDGMADLASMDADGDGQVTPLDPLWTGLRLFQDADGDGRSSPEEIRLLDALGISALSVLWERTDQEDGEGLRRAGTSSFTRADGTTGLMLDYYFGFKPDPSDG